MAHTAALSSDNRLIEGALKQAGITAIHKYSHLFQAAKALAMMPLPRGNRVSFLAPSGAMLVHLTDLCLKRLGLDVPALEETSRQKLQDMSPPYIRMRNPVDIWPAALASDIATAYGQGMEIALNDPNIDAVAPVLMLTEDFGAPPLDFIVDLAKKYPAKPILVTFSGDRGLHGTGQGFSRTQRRADLFLDRGAFRDSVHPEPCPSGHGTTLNCRPKRF